MTLTPTILRELLDYGPETGRLYWKKRDPKYFPGRFRAAADDAAAWNNKFAGKEALTADKGNGYRVGSIFHKKVLAHRAAWAIYYGQWPDNQIDHINHNRGDNRIANLRDVSLADNCRNNSLRADNTSGVAGVYRNPNGKPWTARISVNGINRYLGRFSTLEEAASARRDAEEKYGFHENHGTDPMDRAA